MKELRSRQKLRNYLYSLPALVVLVIVAFLLARGAMAIMNKNHESAAKLTQLEGENAALRERQVTLEGNLAKLDTDEGIMETIRAKFNAVRAGEYLAVIVEEKPRVATTSSGIAEQLRRSWSWVKRLWSF